MFSGSLYGGTGYTRERKLLRSVDDHSVGQIVRGKSDRDPVAEDDSNAELSHAATELGAHGSRVGRHLKLSASENLCDHTVELDVILSGLALVVPILAAFPLSAALTFTSSACQFVSYR